MYVHASAVVDDYNDRHCDLHVSNVLHRLAVTPRCTEAISSLHSCILSRSVM